MFVRVGRDRQGAKAKVWKLYHVAKVHEGKLRNILGEEKEKVKVCYTSIFMLYLKCKMQGETKKITLFPYTGFWKKGEKDREYSETLIQ